MFFYFRSIFIESQVEIEYPKQNIYHLITKF